MGISFKANSGISAGKWALKFSGGLDVIKQWKIKLHNFLLIWSCWKDKVKGHSVPPNFKKILKTVPISESSYKCSSF